MSPASAPSHRGLFGAAWKDLARLGDISRVLFHHGVGPLVDPADAAEADSQDSRRPRVLRMPGETVRRLRQLFEDPHEAGLRLRTMLQELGPTFVKVGQILSTRTDLFPAPVTAQLATLQDRVEPMPWSDVRHVVEAALQRPLEEAFANFEQTALASASIAQIHRATLPDGRAVVVKVQRRGITDLIRADLDLLMMVAHLLEATIEEMQYYAPTGVVKALDSSLEKELDFHHEAGNLTDFRRALEGQGEVVVPQPWPSHCARTVLTMECLEGERLMTLASDPARAEAMALRVIETFYEQIFVWGHYHADPHPGNLMALHRDGRDRLGIIDFGLCGRLSAMQREQLIQLVGAVLTGDVDGTARMLLRMGRPMGTVDLALFKHDVSDIRSRYFRHNLDDIDIGAFVSEVFEAAQRHHIRIAVEYTLLGKTALTLEGVVRGLAPSLDVMAHVRPYGLRMLQELYSPERLLHGAAGAALQMGHLLREVPDQLSQVLQDAQAGRLQVQMRNAALEGVAGELNQQTSRLLLGLMAGSLTLAAPMWYAHEPWPLWGGRVPGMTVLCVLGALVAGSLSIVWHVDHWRRGRKVRMLGLVRLLRGQFR
jgi:ubiquinone biosynthesis protein